MANAACEQLAFRFFEKFVQQIQAGNVIESIQAFASIAPILVVLAPYIYAFHSQAPSRRWLREICRDFTGAIPPALQNKKRAWFTDTLEDVNGVSTTIRKMAAAARDAGEELVVVTSRGELTVDDLPIKNFKPIGEFELPEYELQKLSFPPILQMLDYIQRENFSEIIISTPGPIGLTALLAGKMLNLETSGIYHTDFPQYIRILTEDSFLESLAWKYMHWFYGQLDTIFVNSEQYRQSWIDRGVDAAKLKILPRGLDTAPLHPGAKRTRFLETIRQRRQRGASFVRWARLERKGPRHPRPGLPQPAAGKRSGAAFDRRPRTVFGGARQDDAGSLLTPVTSTAPNWPGPTPPPTSSSSRVRPTPSATSSSKPRPPAYP